MKYKNEELEEEFINKINKLTKKNNRNIFYFKKTLSKT